MALRKLGLGMLINIVDYTCHQLSNQIFQVSAKWVLTDAGRKIYGVLSPVGKGTRLSLQ